MYLECVTVNFFRNALGKLRTSSHDLEIERGRYSNTERNQRKCKLCNTEIETEYNFVLKCPRLTSLREKYIPSKFYQSPNISKFNILMSSKNVDIVMKLDVFFIFVLSKNVKYYLMILFKFIIMYLHMLDGIHHTYMFRYFEFCHFIYIYTCFVILVLDLYSTLALLHIMCVMYMFC